MKEPTLADVEVAIAGLSAELRTQLAAGPIQDPDDPDACRVCDTFDPWLYGATPGSVWAEDEGGDRYLKQEGPHDRAVFVLIDYHRTYADDGRGEESFRRCQTIYELAREAA